MKNEFKQLFTTKKGLLVFFSIVTALVTAYLNLITLKATPGFWIFQTGISYGTLLVSFVPMLIGDLLAEVYGWKKSFIISSVSYTVALVFIFILWGTTTLPGLVFGSDGFTLSAYNTIFGQQWSILIGSAIAYYAGIFFNAFIMGKMQKKAKESGKDTNWKLFARCILSTVVGQLLDNSIFFFIAYMPSIINPTANGWESNQLVLSYIWQQIVAAFVIENLYEIILFPLTKFLRKKILLLPEN